jgi:hypothetical protein
MAVARHQPRDSSKGMLFSVLSMPKCYKQEIYSMEWSLFVGERLSCAVQSLWAVAVRSWWLRHGDNLGNQKKGNVHQCRWKPLLEDW